VPEHPVTSYPGSLTDAEDGAATPMGIATPSPAYYTSLGLTVTSTSLTVTENAAATPIGLPAPSDISYTSSQLKVIVTGLPTGGTVLLSDGVTAVTNGEILTVAH
jgi:hypothetical protein